MAFILSGAAYGFLEVFLLNIILKNVLKGKVTLSAIFLLLKLTSYAAALLLIYFFFMESVKSLVIGYSIGVFLTIPIILLASRAGKNKSASAKGDDTQ